MKKLIAILGALGLTATGASSVVACNNNKKEDTNDLTKSFKSSYNANNTGIDLGNYGIE
ncbi:hypothetical protein P344_03985 [Spiroplasma mirum ATCC 29335]|uniref:Lipoprotein n=1 Tax=Spiroplasma mirum ATCC 29335 TaxID=838561 RepID=W6AN27_9MOLU|nr:MULTISPECIES: lipoprotein [Spiroplasma]AHI58125.1 hypothetical protein P344_03985 [Spiroplasma mirum ATCC 29335]